MTLALHELKRNYKALLIWSGIVGLLIFILVLLFPEMESQMAGLFETYKNMGDFSVAFGMDKLDFSTLIGFYGIEAGTMLALGGSSYAAITAIGMLAKEEGGHTAEFLHSAPRSRGYIVTQKFAALVILLLAFNLICLLAALASFFIIGESIPMDILLLYHLAQLVMQFELACICFGISAFLRRVNVGLGIGIAMLLYFMNIFINISESVGWLKYITPFNYSDSAVIFTDKSLNPVLLCLGLLYASAGLICAYIKYVTKDIAA